MSLFKAVIGIAGGFAAVKVVGYLWKTSGFHDDMLEGVAQGRYIRAKAEAKGEWPTTAVEQYRYIRRKQVEYAERFGTSHWSGMMAEKVGKMVGDFPDSVAEQIEFVKRERDAEHATLNGCQRAQARADNAKK